MKLTKRLLSLLLTAALLLTMMPAVFAAKTEPDYAAANKVFAQIDTTLDRLQTRNAGLTDAEKTAVAKEAVEAMGYATEQKGEGYFTFSVDGKACCYSARIRDIAEQAQPIDGYVDDGQVVKVSYDKRGGSSSVSDVALIQPYYGIDSDFTKQYQTECASIASATGGTYTLYKTTAATIDAIADALETCAVVVFDSHGDTDYAGAGEDYTSRANTSYLCLQTGNGLTSADQAELNGTYGSYSHAVYAGYGDGGMYFYEVDGTAIMNHVEKTLPNNFVWSAICLGMATDGLEKPLIDGGAGVVYGYSQSVTFDGDYAYEEDFWTKMKAGATVATAAAYMKSANNCSWDPAYNDYTLAQAKRNYIAFPIFVSAQDVYPGKGSVDAVQTVNSGWTLLSNYTLTAQSGNPAYGTVTKNGMAITAIPATGYYASGYSVSPSGACTVAQNGNSFTVSGMQQDCTVTIQFAEKVPATVRFSTPSGVTAADIGGYCGESIVLPTPTGSPENSAAYTFLGWTTAAADGVTEKPTCYAAGSSYPVSGNTTLYALYRYVVTGTDGTTTDYFKADLSDLSQSDSVVVTMSKGGTVYALTNTETTSSPVAATVSVKDNTISNPADTLKWNIKNLNGNLTLYPAGTTARWLYCTNENTGVRIGTGAANLFTIQNSYLKNSSTGRYVGVYTTKPDWRCYTGTTTNISGQTLGFYAAASGTTCYTTVISSECLHQWGSGVVTTPATCTATGVRTFTCSLCAQKKTETIAKTDHTVVQDAAVAATCTVAGKTAGSHCAVCNTVLVAQTTVPATGHTVVVDAAIAATCTAAGKTAGSHCSVCNEIFTAQTTLPATGHTVVVDSAVAATCTTAGKTAGSHCSVCNEILTAQTIIVATGHTVVVDASVAATCTTAGKTAGSHCSVCNEVFTAQTKIDAFGHKDANFDGTCDVCGASLAQNNPFVDNKNGTFYYNAVLWAAQMQITAGTDATHFSPETNCTRAQVVTFLWRAMGSEAPTATASPFADVSNTQAFYYKAVLWAAEKEITSGVDSTHFAPDATVTRGEFVTFLWRATGKQPSDTAMSFTDVKAGEFYYDAVLWAVDNHVTEGVSKTSFAPKQACTRAQVVTFLWRALG